MTATLDDIRIVRAADLQRQRWANDCGWTREIARWPETGDWQWRLSVADVEAEAPFSAFPGVERILMLLQGEGIALQFDAGERVELQPPHDLLQFPGERALIGAPLDGPTTDFNLMWQRDAIDAALWQRPLVGAWMLFAEPGETWAVHVIGGHLQIDRGNVPALSGGDTLIVRNAGSQRGRLALEGAGQSVLIRLREREQHG